MIASRRRTAPLTLAVLAVLAAPWPGADAIAQLRGHGGGIGRRPPMGGGARPGFSGARPNMPAARPGGMQPRPSMPTMNRPGGIQSRPSMPNLNRPGGGLGAGRPPGGLYQPNRPGLGNRPGLPGSSGDVARPGLGGDRPGLGGDRPGLGGLPSLPGRPGGSGLPSRPDFTLPNRPGGGGDRPALPGLPGIGNRPNLPNLPGGIGNRPNLPNRPGDGGNRPIVGPGNRPIVGPGNRPIIGGSGNRPIIGSGNRPIIGSGNTTNIINNQSWINQNKVVVGGNVNRPGWGWGNVNRPGWGWGGGNAWGRGRWGGAWGASNWSGVWVNNFVPVNYHGWYHGSWSNAWANSWYVPLAYGTTSWALNGLSSWTSGYYGTPYVNPYFVDGASAVYNYSQPIVVQTFTAPDDAPSDVAEAAAPPQPSPEQQRAYELFDRARAAFAADDNGEALGLIEQALRETPGDPIMHEFRALCLFALGDYRGAAAVLNALLAVAPGWDWTTMSSLYGNPSVYTDQLRNLESYCRQHPDDPASFFVLAYHYLILGHDDQAAGALRVVTEQQPGDVVASRMLQALSASSEAPPGQPAAAGTPATPAQPEATDASPAEGDAPDAAPTEDGPSTDLVGHWRAAPDDQVSFELTVGEDGNYSWIVSPKQGQKTAIAGPYSLDGDLLILRNEDQGDLIGEAASIGPDRFTFLPVGAPPGDPGLTFDREAPDAP